MSILHVPVRPQPHFPSVQTVEFATSSVGEARGKANGKKDRRPRLLQPAIPVALECGNFPAKYGERGGARGAPILALLYCMMGVVGCVCWRVWYDCCSVLYSVLSVCRRYGSRFTESQKADLKLHCTTSRMRWMYRTEQNSTGYTALMQISLISQRRR